MMCRCLAHWPDEVRRIFRMLDLAAHGAEGHGPVRLLLISAGTGRRAVGYGLLSPWDAFGAYPTSPEHYF